MNIGLFSSAFCRHWFCEEVVQIWTDDGTLSAWVEVELALAQAQASPDIALIPASAYETMRDQLKTTNFDPERAVREIKLSMHPFVPVLHQLEIMVGEPAAGYLHWGVTTQNIFDTGQSLQLKRSHAILVPYLQRAIEVLGRLSHEHRATPQAGRTHGQHALPITFGYKLAAWRAELRRHLERLTVAAKTSFVASTGGAVGSFSAMNGKGQLVQDRVAQLLGLTSIDIPTRSSSDAVVHYASLLGSMAATAEKISGDIVFLQRTEIAEVGEAFHRGKVGSSTMSQKRNPQAAMNLITLTRILRSRIPLLVENMVRIDEGDAPASNVTEHTVREVAILGVSIAMSLALLVEGLAVNTEAMHRNLHLSGGLIVSEAVMMALAPHLGRHIAHQVLYEVAHEAQDSGQSFSVLILRHPAVLPIAEKIDLSHLLNPENYLGESVNLVDAENKRSCPLVVYVGDEAGKPSKSTL